MDRVEEMGWDNAILMEQLSREEILEMLDYAARRHYDCDAQGLIDLIVSGAKAPPEYVTLVEMLGYEVV